MERKAQWDLPARSDPLEQLAQQAQALLVQQAPLARRVMSVLKEQPDRKDYKARQEQLVHKARSALQAQQGHRGLSETRARPEQMVQTVRPVFKAQ